MSVLDLLKQYDLFDNTICHHAFTEYMRDYQLIARLHVGPGAPGTHTYLFQGCVHAEYDLCLPVDAFSMDETFLDCQRCIHHSGDTIRFSGWH